MAGEPRHVRPSHTDAIADAYFCLHIGQMRTSLALVALMMTFGCDGAEAISNAGGEQQVAVSTPSPTGATHPDIANAMWDWAKCRATKMAVLARTPSSDEAVIDETLRECIVFERAAEALWVKRSGPNSVAQFRAFRARSRDE